ncbi:hypothetical protein ACO0RG_000195 [Hanseniaspora osmophila]|uniref:Dolichyl-diphosphooligosaccharide--protein glycosyltransferase subunit WBP1 n=1 Tax=Hanseniaspora osmophila TaxID=56408 RepID=A0A1E5R588_9ASCO|nr:Dolichyl-diphosphooligosaccharide--protein glycosyltransferase subunit WBP1 [Hanseniaspora osmophila]
MLLYNLITLLCVCLMNDVCKALSVHPLKTLVVFDSRLTSLQDHSEFLQSLENRDHELVFEQVDHEDFDPQFYFLSEDEHSNLYDNMIIFPIKTKRGSSSLTSSKLLKFYENGGDVLAITSPVGVTDPVRLFLNQLSIYPAPKGYILRDYFNASDEKKNTFAIAGSDSLNDYVFNSSSDAELVYSKGSSALLGSSDLLVPILKAPSTSLNKNVNDEEWTIGSQGYLIAAFQNLKNARMTWVGSDKFFANGLYESNNKAFIEELTKWTFREKSVIKVNGAKHYHADKTSYEELPYKTTDEVVYEILLSEFKDNKWIPYEGTDVQFELKMIDPYYRLTMNAEENVGESKKFTTGVFKLPDHHGVFTFQVDYKRPGLTYVESKSTHAIRNLAHTEYPRSWEITNARVYLCSIFAVIGLWLVFVVAFIATSKKVVNKPTAASKKNN